MVAKTVAGFVESWGILNRYVAESAFATQVSALCGWCPLVRSCPVAARDDKVARIDGLPTAVQLGIPTFRPLADTVNDTLTWDNARPADELRKVGLSLDRERELLEKYRKNFMSP